MAPQEKKDAVIIIFDVGKSVSNKSSENGTSFFSQSKECLSWILKRKILTKSNDVVALLLTGTDKPVTSVGSSMCSNVHVKYDFQLASWDMLYYVENIVETSNEASDWVGALAVALDMLITYAESNLIISQTVVIFSDLIYTSSENVNFVLKTMKSQNIGLTFIGTDYVCGALMPDCTEEPPLKKSHLDVEISNVESQEKLSGEKLIHIIWNLVGDLVRIYSFDSAMKQLFAYSKRVVRPMPWNCLLDIGDVKISIQMFKKIDSKLSILHSVKSMKPRSQTGEAPSEASFSEVVTDTVMYYEHRVENKEIHEEISVTKDEIVSGFRYGTRIIPFSDEDQSVMGFKPGRKSFSILGFTHINNVPYYILTGEGSYVVVAYDKDEKAEVALSALVQAMFQTKHVAIVRRVYSDERGLSLGVLYPVVEDPGEDEISHKEYLMFIELAFAEDIKSIRLPRLKRMKEKIKPEQYAIVDNIIDQMDLMKADRINGEPSEALDCRSRHEIKNQFYQHCIVHRALYLEEPLPEALPDYCQRYIQQPKSIADICEFLGQQLTAVFSCERKEQSEQGSDSLKSSDEQVDYTFACGEQQTAENFFKKLFSLYTYPPSEEIRKLLKVAGEKYNFKKEDIVKAFLYFTAEARKEALQTDRKEYNNWIQRCRIDLGIEGSLKRNFWKGVLEGNLGLITKDEHSDSLLTEENAKYFMDLLKQQLQEKYDDERKRKAKEEEDEAVEMLF